MCEMAFYLTVILSGSTQLYLRPPPKSRHIKFESHAVLHKVLSPSAVFPIVLFLFHDFPLFALCDRRPEPHQSKQPPPNFRPFPRPLRCFFLRFSSLFAYIPDPSAFSRQL